jgi:hypothetical protein
MKHEQWRFDLLKAAQLIRENGLQKNNLQGPNGYCLMGAIISSSSLDNSSSGLDNKAAINTAIKQVKRCFERSYDVAEMGNNSAILAWWNDRPERTAQEVIDLLERAAGDEARSK